jgi:hypothetical protein
MKKYITLLTFLTTLASFSQNLNEYKYALLPLKFSFQKEKDQYRLNSLSKLYLEKYGFETYYDIDIQPTDFINNNCNKVFVDVISNGGMFVTKLYVVLKDCRGNILYTSKEGSSREKEYALAYNLAIRMAFESMQNLNHNFKNTIEKEENIDPKDKVEASENELFAQPISNGFQLINSEPKLIMKIFKTSSKDCFIAIKETINGVLILKNNHWTFEYYQNEKLISEIIRVKIED